MNLQPHVPANLKSKLISIVATSAALIMGFTANPALAKDRQKFTDYARVVHVEPAYRYVTVKVPQRVCTPRYNPRANHRSHKHRHQLNSNAQHPRSSQRYSQYTDSTGAVFTGAVIGGAIGHQVSRTVNGRSTTVATAAGRRDEQHNNHGAKRPRVTSTQHNQNQNNQNNHNRQQRRDRNQHSTPRNHHQHGTQQHCTTTTETKRERRNDGYHVTYMYKGRSFSTQTSRHPGKRIAIQVALSTGH